MINIKDPNLGNQVSLIAMDDGGWLKEHSKVKEKDTNTADLHAGHNHP